MDNDVHRFSQNAREGQWYPMALRVKMSETVSGIEFTEQGEQGFSG